AVRGQHLAQRVRFARELVAELEALVANLAALAERRFERRLAAERWQVVVAPRNRIDADLNFHDCFFFPASYSARALRTSARSDLPGTATSHHQPPSLVVCAGSVSMQMT